METRANHVVIGCFVLAVVAGVFGFVIWLAKIDIDREIATYAITFHNAVTGLSVGGDVRFNGIRVGEVTRIKIDRDNLERVLVRVDLEADTPVRENTVASLEFQGITGVSYIQLSGGGADKTLLWPPANEGEVPEIGSEPSAIQELFAGAPELIDRFALLVNRAALVVSDKNLAHLTNILENAEVISQHVAEKGPEIGQTIENINRMTADLSAAAADFRKLVPEFKEAIEEGHARRLGRGGGKRPAPARGRYSRHRPKSRPAHHRGRGRDQDEPGIDRRLHLRRPGGIDQIRRGGAHSGRQRHPPDRRDRRAGGPTA